MMMKSTFRRLRAPGFTLIEVMITVVIIGIISAVAFPSYTEYIRRGHRGNAQAILMETAQFMERFNSANGTYVGATLPTAVSPKGATGTAVRYDITFSVAPTVGAFTLKAEPKNKQVGEKCGALTLSSTGVQTPTPATCW